MGYYSGTDAAENIRGTYVDDEIYLYGGNDVANGSFGSDWIYGGTGNDRILGAYQDDYLYGEEGNDRLNGGSGSDVLTGGAGRDVVDAGTGDDRIVVDGPIELRGDRVFGGTGIDTLALNFSDAADFRFAARDSLLVSSVAGMSFRDIERYEIQGGERNDVISGWLLGDDFDGNGGNDRLSGYFGDDSLDGGEGNDTLLGGGGDDYLYASDGNDLVRGGFGHDGIYGSLGNDRLFGEAGDDNMVGGSGRDVLSGGAGNDTLDSDDFQDSGRERDSLNAGAGNDDVSIGIGDVANGQTGNDRLTAYFAESTSNETFVLRQAVQAFANGARVSGFEALEYTGGSGRDAITGGRFADNLVGGGGNDRLNGSGGADFLDGDEGNDVLVGGAGNDTLSHDSGNDRMLGQGGADTFNIDWDEESSLPYRVAVNGGAGRDTVSFDSTTLGAVVDLLVQSRNDGVAYGKTLASVEVLLGSILDDNFAGSNRADTFFGMDGDDVLSGRAGSDRLVGGSGSDLLIGGAGADVFDFTDYQSDNWRGDTISDFTRGQDKLLFDLSDLGWRSQAGVRLISGADPDPVGGGANLLYDNVTHRLWIDEDGAGSTDGPELLLTLNGVRALSESDFVFV